MTNLLLAGVPGAHGWNVDNLLPSGGGGGASASMPPSTAINIAVDEIDAGAIPDRLLGDLVRLTSFLA